MSKFIMIGGEIINTELLAYVRIVEPGDPFLISNPSVPANSVIYSVCPAITVKPIFNTYAEAKEWVDKLFKMLTAEKKEAENSGKPKSVSFEKYQDQWLTAKLIYCISRIRSLQLGEEYKIMPYQNSNGEKCIAIRIKKGSKITKYFNWSDVEFELAEEGGNHE